MPNLWIPVPDYTYVKPLFHTYGQIICHKIVTYRKYASPEAPPIKSIYNSIAANFDDMYSIKLKYIQVQKMFRTPADQNIRFNHKMAIIGYLLKESPQVTTIDLPDIFWDRIKKEFRIALEGIL